MPDAAEIIVASLAMLAGSTVLATLGFGIALTSSPFLLLVLDPQTVVVMLNTVAIVLLAMLVVQTRKHLPSTEIVPVSVAGVLGVPVGVYALSTLNAGVLRMGIAGLILALAVAVAFNVRVPTGAPRISGPAVGFVVGALISGLGIGGPLIVLYLLGRDWPRQVVRASTSVYYLALSLAAVVGYIVAGLYTTERVVLTLIVVAPVALGFGVATLLVRRMDERSFRRAVLAVIIVTSLMVLGREALAV